MLFYCSFTLDHQLMQEYQQQLLETLFELGCQWHPTDEKQSINRTNICECQQKFVSAARFMPDNKHSLKATRAHISGYPSGFNDFPLHTYKLSLRALEISPLNQLYTMEESYMLQALHSIPYYTHNSPMLTATGQIQLSSPFHFGSFIQYVRTISEKIIFLTL